MGRGLGAGTSGRATPARSPGPVRGARMPFVLRRAGSAPLLPASLLLAVLVSVLVTTALASFAARAPPAAAHQRLARASAATAIQVSGQVDAARASADEPVIRTAIRSALGPVPFTLASARWSDQLALPRPGGGNQVPLIQAAVLGGAAAHTVLTAPGTRLMSSPEAALPAGRPPPATRAGSGAALMGAMTGGGAGRGGAPAG